MFYTALSVIVVALGALLALVALRLLWRSRWLMGWLKGMAGLGLLALALVFALVAFDVYSYQQIIKEQSVATLTFEQLGPQHYRAEVVTSGGNAQDFELRGDQWQMDARLIKWKGIVGGLGIKPAYRLDRLGGRYFSLEQERTAERTVHALSESDTVDVWSWLNERPNLVPVVDAVYGSATFMPMADGALYEVTLSHTGLLARPLNDSATQAVSQWR